MRDALSCAALRLFAELAHTLYELPAELRDFVSCALVTLTTAFTANFASRGPARLCAALGLQFFTRYDTSLRTRLSILTLNAEQSDAERVERSKLTSMIDEWQEFVGRSTAAHAMSWFYWHAEDASGALNVDLFPAFFRVQLCKGLRRVRILPPLSTTLIVAALCSCESAGFFDVIYDPTPLLTAHIDEK